jgi:hypothetical protein
VRTGITEDARDVAEVGVPLRQCLQMIVQIQSFARSCPVIEPDWTTMSAPQSVSQHADQRR